MWELAHTKGWMPKNWCFPFVLVEKTLESPLDCKRIKPVNPKGNQPWVLEGLVLKLKLQYFGHLMQRANSLEKILMLGKTEGKRREQQRMSWLDSITNSVAVWINSGSWWWTGKPGLLQSMGSQSRTRLSNRTELKMPSMWRMVKETMAHPYNTQSLKLLFIKSSCPEKNFPKLQNSITNSMDRRLSKLREFVMDREPWRAWTELKCCA